MLSGECRAVESTITETYRRVMSVLPVREQPAHPEQATYDLQHAFQLVTVDLMRPVIPAALGGYSYVTKFVDQHTKWKQICFIKTKPQALDALELHNKALVIPNDTRLIHLRADKGMEITSSEFIRYCHDIGVSLQFASPNTPQQIGSNERAGRTIDGILRCLIVSTTVSLRSVDTDGCLLEQQGSTRSIG